MWVAFLMGLSDCLNPVWLATSLLFLFYISVVCHTKSQMASSGFVYIVVMLSVNFFSLIGVYDPIYQNDQFSQTAKYVELILGLVFILIGILHFIDWRRFYHRKGSESFKWWIPGYWNPPKDGHRGYHSGLVVFLSSVLAWTFSIFAGIWTQNYYLFVLLYKLAENGKMILYGPVYLAYSASLMLPFLLICLIFVFRARWQEIFNRHSGVFKAFFSILFLSIGLGLSFFILEIIKL